MDPEKNAGPAVREHATQAFGVVGAVLAAVCGCAVWTGAVAAAWGTASGAGHAGSFATAWITATAGLAVTLAAAGVACATIAAVFSLLRRCNK